MYKNPLKCFRNPTSFFIANLGIADLLNSKSYSVTDSVRNHFLFSRRLGNDSPRSNWLYFSFNFPKRYCPGVGTIYAHEVTVTFRRCYTWIAVVWLAKFIYTGITVISVAQDKSSLSIVLTLYLSVFYLTTILIYFLAFVSIRKQRYLLSTDVTKSEMARRMLELRLRNQNRFLSTWLIINIVLTFGLISTIISLYLQYRQYVSKTEGTMDVWLPVTNILLFLNTAANPFLYIWRLPKDRKTFSVMYCCKKNNMRV